MTKFKGLNSSTVKFQIELMGCLMVSDHQDNLSKTLFKLNVLVTNNLKLSQHTPAARVLGKLVKT